MKRLSLAAELILWVITLLPLLYLWLNWAQLPELVPVHFNTEGDPNRWAGKGELIAIVFFITVGLHLLLLLIPRIDPKGRIKNMGRNYDKLRIILVLFMSSLAILLIYSASTGEISPQLLFVLIGCLFAALGNYFQAVKPNYFIGIRTPWTLESENVWRKTHRIAGPLWVIGGILVALLAFINDPTLREVTFLSIIAILVIVPIAHSYLSFRKEKAVQ